MRGLDQTQVGGNCRRVCGRHRFNFKTCVVDFDRKGRFTIEIQLFLCIWYLSVEYKSPAVFIWAGIDYMLIQLKDLKPLECSKLSGKVAYDINYLKGCV